MCVTPWYYRLNSARVMSSLLTFICAIFLSQFVWDFLICFATLFQAYRDDTLFNHSLLLSLHQVSLTDFVCLDWVSQILSSCYYYLSLMILAIILIKNVFKFKYAFRMRVFCVDILHMLSSHFPFFFVYCVIRWLFRNQYTSSIIFILSKKYLLIALFHNYRWHLMCQSSQFYNIARNWY